MWDKIEMNIEKLRNSEWTLSSAIILSTILDGSLRQKSLKWPLSLKELKQKLDTAKFG